MFLENILVRNSASGFFLVFDEFFENFRLVLLVVFIKSVFALLSDCIATNYIKLVLEAICSELSVKIPQSRVVGHVCFFFNEVY